MNIDSLNINNVDYTLSAFNGTLICNQAVGSAKSVTFPIGYNFDGQLSFKVLFVNGHNCTNSTTYMTLNDKPIKVYSHGTLTNLPIHTMTENNTTVYKSLQANTILELYYDTSINAFVVVGNPIVYSSSSFVIYADGDYVYKQTTYTSTDTSNTDRKLLLGEKTYSSSCQGNVYVSTSCAITFNPSTGVLTAPMFCGGVSGNATTACNATCFANCTYAQACANIRSGLTSCTGTVTVSNSDSNTDIPIALCTGATAIGQSCGCSLTFNPSTGVLTTTTFCGSLNGTASNANKLENNTLAQVVTCARNGLSYTECNIHFNLISKYNNVASINIANLGSSAPSSCDSTKILGNALSCFGITSLNQASFGATGLTAHRPSDTYESDPIYLLYVHGTCWNTNTNVDYLINGATLCQKNKSGNWATCFDVGARLNIQVVYN